MFLFETLNMSASFFSLSTSWEFGDRFAHTCPMQNTLCVDVTNALGDVQCGWLVMACLKPNWETDEVCHSPNLPFTLFPSFTWWWSLSCCHLFPPQAPQAFSDGKVVCMCLLCAVCLCDWSTPDSMLYEHKTLDKLLHFLLFQVPDCKMKPRVFFTS